MEAVNKGMAKGAIWTIMFKFVTRGIGLLSTVILARLLIPEDFGLVAIAMAIIGALEVLSAFSFDTVLIQNQQAERKHYDTAWTFGVIVGAIQAMLLVLIAPWVADFYDDQRLVAIMYVLALGRLVTGTANIGMVAFRKDLQFHKDFQYEVTKKLAGFTTTMIMAYTLRSYWALIGGMITGSVVGVGLSYLMQSYRPRFSLEATGELFHFSKWLLINNMLLFLVHQSSSFIIGKIGGPHELGVFTVSNEISNLPSTDLVAPINRAIFPGYAKMSSQLSILRQGYVNVFSAITYFVLPAGVGIVLLAEPIVHLMLGAKWAEAVPLIQILAISGTIAALQTNQGSVYLSLGRPRMLTMLAGIHAALLVPALVF
ncbi:MAG: lipopolysaccharide biosynthesis protein, partial [Halioglobus sp.]